MNTIPCNPNMQQEARDLLKYLSNIEGKGILTGQHTQTCNPQELVVIERETGKMPALCGFELLAYSPNIHLEDASPECIKEVTENQGTLALAKAWAKKGGILTFTWHWFSPMGGHDKAFYTENTSFDADAALQAGTQENIAFLHDLDHMAMLLKPFCE